MKKSIITFLLLFSLMPLSVLGASEPNLISTFTINDSLLFTSSGNPYYRTDLPTQYDQYPEEQIYFYPTDTYSKNDYTFEVWDDYLATLSQSSSGSCLLEIYNWRTGNLIYETTIPTTCSAGYLLYDGAGNLIVGLDTVASQTTVELRNAVYDVSNIGFVGQRNYTYYGTNSISVSWREKFVVSTTGETVEWIAGGVKYKINSTDALTNLGTTGVLEEPQHYGIDLFDKENGVFVKADYRTSPFSQVFVAGYDDFYRIDGSDLDLDSYDSPTLIGTVEANVGVVADWNNNYLNPEYITTEGHLMLVGGSDYDNFQTSSANLNFTPKFFFERDNIIGVKNNKWVYADMTDLSAITEGVGTADVNADFMIRFDDNKILTYNRTNFEFKIYEVPLPSFADEEAIAGNTPPSKTLELLGVDNNGRFVFAGTFSDNQGGLIFEALQIGSQNDFLDNEFVRQIVNHQKTPSQVTTICPDSTYYYASQIRGERFIENPTVVDMEDYGDWCPINYLFEPITQSQTDSFNITGSFAVTGYSAGGDFLDTGFTLYDSEDNIMANILIGSSQFESQPSNVTIAEDGTTYYNILVSEEPLNDGINTIYNYEITINFTAKELLLSIWEYPTYYGDYSGKDYLIQNEVIPFWDSNIEDFSRITFGLVGDQLIFSAGSVTTRYINELKGFPEYELIDTFEAGETQVISLRSDDSYESGQYTALLYATDNTLGLSYYENPFNLFINYNVGDLEVLSEEQIQSAIASLQTGANDGFRTVGVIEGDLVTDTLFGYLDDWDIKSTASKFLVGFLLLLGAVWLGAKAGGVVSPVASAIGSIVGAVSGLFLVTYWGFIPAWVSLIIVLVVFVVIASYVRNSLTGGGS